MAKSRMDRKLVGAVGVLFVSLAAGPVLAEGASTGSELYGQQQQQQQQQQQRQRQVRPEDERGRDGNRSNRREERAREREQQRGTEERARTEQRAREQREADQRAREQRVVEERRRNNEQRVVEERRRNEERAREQQRFSDQQRTSERRSDWRRDDNRRDDFRRDEGRRDDGRRDRDWRDRDGHSPRWSDRRWHGPTYASPYRRHVWVGGHRYDVRPDRRRVYGNVVILRPYGHWYYGYGRYYRDVDAYRWLGLTAITFASLNYLNEYQQRALEDAQIAATTAPIGAPIVWAEPGAQGSVVATRDGWTESGQYCREFQQTVEIGGRVEQAYGTACQQPDGAWQVTSQ